MKRSIAILFLLFIFQTPVNQVLAGTMISLEEMKKAISQSCSVGKEWRRCEMIGHDWADKGYEFEEYIYQMCIQIDSYNKRGICLREMLMRNL